MLASGSSVPPAQVPNLAFLSLGKRLDGANYRKDGWSSLLDIHQEEHGLG
jgi:hypothetical protein